jgi:predicted Abi (CAAX) family protease
MKIKLIEDPRVCPACPTQLDDFSNSRRYNNCAIQRYLGTDETVRTDEQVRLLLSRDAVQREIGISEVGGSPW